MGNRVHLIAIGGAVMHNLALNLKENGFEVSGSDDEIFEPAKSRLANKGLLPATMGWNADRITADLSFIILGMHAKADNPELLKAKELGLPVYSFPEYVYQHSKNKQRIVIAGSHGKTTITSMIMHVLKKLNREFDYLVGSLVDGFETMVKLSDSAPVIIIEGDEYLTSPLDLTPKFLKYKHHIAVVSGVAWDHINVFPNEEIYIRQFDHLADASPKGGTLIFNDQDYITSIICKKERDDVTAVPYHEHKSEVVDGETFLLEGKNKYPISVFGSHNLSNISAAKAVCKEMGINAPEFFVAIADFKGAGGRMQVLAKKPGTIIFKDFAHAPSKVMATTKAVKKQFLDRKLIACLELHTFSSLNKKFIEQYAGTLKAADVAAVYYNPKVVEHKNLEPINPQELVEAFKNPALKVFTDSAKLMEFIKQQPLIQTNLLLMSSGNFDGFDLQALANELI